jgi:hypothetical protein
VKLVQRIAVETIVVVGFAWRGPALSAQSSKPGFSERHYSGFFHPPIRTQVKRIRAAPTTRTRGSQSLRWGRE